MVEELVYQPDFKVLRIDFLVDMVVFFSKHYFNKNYNVAIENAERLNLVKDKGFMLLPKHQSALDITLEGILLKNQLNRHGYFVMKDSLPKIYQLLGGIPISRGKESKMVLRRISDKEKRRGFIQSDEEKNPYKKEKRELIQEAKKRRYYVDNAMLNLLIQGEIVVLHFEGRTAYQETTKIRKSIIKRLIQIQNAYLRYKNEQFYFVPLDFDYEDVKKKASKITLSVGNPIKTNNLDELTHHLAQEIELVEK